jgi:hypothetical protein
LVGANILGIFAENESMVVFTLNIIGFIVSGISSCALFLIKAKPIEIVYKPELDIIRHDGKNPGYEYLARKIEESNKRNENIFKSSKRWFAIGVVGLSLQGSSIILGAFTDEISNRENKCSKQVKSYNKCNDK